MTKELQTHSTMIALFEPVSSEVAVGAGFVLKVKVSCSAGCDLHGMSLRIVEPGGNETIGALAAHDANVNESGAIALKAPCRVGHHAWTVMVEPQEIGGIRHEGCSLPVTMTAIPQQTSLAVWDIPSPVVKGNRFSIKVGAKSAADYELKGASIAVCDETGAMVAHGRLQETPFPGTTALYWTMLELLAPDKEGLSAWSVRFAATDLAVPHDGAAAQFSVMLVKPPEHRLTVKVIEKESKAPIEDVQVRLGPYRAATDPSGLAEVMMPKGAYDLHIWKTGYEAPSRTVDVSGDGSVELEASIVPEDDPDAAWTM